MPTTPHSATAARTTAWPLSNLPPQPTPLIGRDEDLAALRQVLLRPDVRAVTLTGPPGAGKTRLATAVAATLIEDFADGVCFVPLETVHDPAEVVPAIARVRGPRESGDQSLREALVGHLGTSEMLLVLDNFEQVLDAAGEVAALLAACPRLTVLVTSRAPLRIRWEQEVLLGPLALPPAGSGNRRSGGEGGGGASEIPHTSSLPSEQFLTYGAVALFVARAQAVQPDFRLNEENAATVAAICGRLDGLPLAIELAAARVKLFPPRALLERLGPRLGLLTRAARDLPPRHQTLRAAIAWSYDLLAPAEQALLHRLSVFRGGCTLDAVEAVAGESGADLLDGIASLVDQSLLVRAEDGDSPDPAGRFRLLETVHEYALEHLEASAEAPVVRRRHAEYFLALADRSFLEVRSPGLRSSVERLRRELGNLRAALDWSVASADGEAALRLAGSLVFFWWADGHVVEGRRWIERALAEAAGAGAPARLRALLAAGCLAFLQGDHQAAAAALSDGHALLQTIGESPDMAWAIAMLANLQPDFERRRALAEESLTRCRLAGDRWGCAFALHELGLLARDAGDRARAVTLIEDAAARFRELDDRSSMARTLLNLGAVVQRDGVYERARDCFAEGLAVLAELDEPEGIARALQRIGELAAERGDAERAARLLAAAEAQFQSIGVQFRPRERARLDRHLVGVLARLGEERAALAQAAGRAMAPAEAVAYAHDALSGRDEGGGMRDDVTAEVGASSLIPPPSSLPGGLTAREVDVLRLLAAGRSSKQIGVALAVSTHTVERHIANLYRKIDAHGRAEATAYAIQRGLL